MPCGPDGKPLSTSSTPSRSSGTGTDIPPPAGPR
jgi:hypothetical protein